MIREGSKDNIYLSFYRFRPLNFLSKWRVVVSFVNFIHVGDYTKKVWWKAILRLNFEKDPLCFSERSQWICVFFYENIEIIYSYTQNNIRVNMKLISKMHPLNSKFKEKFPSIAYILHGGVFQMWRCSSKVIELG